MLASKFIAPAIFALALAPVLSQTASAAADPTGIWIDDKGRGAVDIKPCGNKLCGTVAWVKSKADAHGCGKQIIGDVQNVGGGVWDNGWVYSPERGRKYDVELKPLSNGTLQVTGYAGTKFFSQTMIWTKAPADLQLCGQPEVKAEAPKPAPAEKAPATAEASTSDDVTETFDDKPAAPQKKAAAPVKTETEEPAPAPKAKTATAEPKEDPAPATNDKTASDDKPATDDRADNGRGGNDLGKLLGGLKLGDLNLDKVITKGKSGKCQVDTPWVKVQFACEH